jgi:hypothetical protein
MPVSKRTRFEVLRRDSHACQYCGQMAPEVVLHVDHVEPTTLGGSDKPDNLVTACKDCNLGKASIAPDSPLVANLSARASAYALGMTDKMTRLRASIEEADEYCTEFEDDWDGFTVNGEPVERPIDYETTIHRWHRLGVPMRMISLAIKSAMALRNPGSDFGRFRYMCGIVWNQIDDSGLDYSLTSETVKVYMHAEVDGGLVPDAYDYGWRAGFESATKHEEGKRHKADVVAAHIDGRLVEANG